MVIQNIFFKKSSRLCVCVCMCVHLCTCVSYVPALCIRERNLVLRVHFLKEVMLQLKQKDKQELARQCGGWKERNGCQRKGLTPEVMRMARTRPEIFLQKPHCFWLSHPKLVDPMPCWPRGHGCAAAPHAMHAFILFSSQLHGPEKTSVPEAWFHAGTS